MKPLLLILALALAGCARNAPAPQTATVRLAGQVVAEKLGSASKRARVLHDAVPIDLKPAVEQLQEDLKQATEAKLAQDVAVEQLGRDIVIQTQQLAAAREERDAALASRNRWRKYTAWTGSAALLLLLFIVRKPIMRLVGIPL